jgi:hypothetical protein
MSEFTSELNELKSFVADLKADRTAQKEKEQREAWTKYTSLSLVFIAVLAAVAAQWSGRYGSRVLVQLNDSTFSQAKASDQWAYYQAKSIKQSLFEVARDQLQTNRGAAGEPAQAEQKITGRIDRYETEKKGIEAEARKIEKERDEFRAKAQVSSDKGGKMGRSVAVFQIAIAMGSICLVTKKKPLWYLALVLAALATFEMIQAWLI